MVDYNESVSEVSILRRRRETQHCSIPTLATPGQRTTLSRGLIPQFGDEPLRPRYLKVVARESCTPFLPPLTDPTQHHDPRVQYTRDQASTL
jgi:hypothetical protein